MFRLSYCRISTKKDNFYWSEVNSGVKNAQYAVRGVVPTAANLMKQDLISNPNNYPFKQITFCNIGNPQQFHQQPISFNRQVLSCMMNPKLIGSSIINPDASKRTNTYLKEIISVGSYTHSLGIPLYRKSIAKYIARQDQVEQPSIEQIFMTEGASQGVHMLISSMITTPNDAIMIPIPQYPLYSAAIALYNGSMMPYFLNEDKGWQLDEQQLRRSYNQCIKNNKKIKSIVVINPGNPTGAIFSAETIKNIIKFAVENKIIIIADQVYRQNIYKPDTIFSSFRKVLNTMDNKTQQQCQLASLHSVSKGLLGQCGLRGGYLYLHNFNPKVVAQLVKLKSINLCSNSMGQSMVEMMVNPPLQDVTQNTKQQYLSQYENLFTSLKKRAQIVTKTLRQMKNITCNQVQGAMYAFPRVHFPAKAIEAAKLQNRKIEQFYCLQVLKNTGIAIVPGSGFGTMPNSYHFRITTLILPQTTLQERLIALGQFNNKFHDKYC